MSTAVLTWEDRQTPCKAPPLCPAGCWGCRTTYLLETSGLCSSLLWWSSAPPHRRRSTRSGRWPTCSWAAPSVSSHPETEALSIPKQRLGSFPETEAPQSAFRWLAPQRLSSPAPCRTVCSRRLCLKTCICQASPPSNVHSGSIF